MILFFFSFPIVRRCNMFFACILEVWCSPLSLGFEVRRLGSLMREDLWASCTLMHIFKHMKLTEFHYLSCRILSIISFWESFCLWVSFWERNPHCTWECFCLWVSIQFELYNHILLFPQNHCLFLLWVTSTSYGHF